MKHSCHHAKGSGSWGKLGDGKGHRVFIGEGWRESPRGRNLHFSDITFTVCGFKTGSSDHRNNTPATGESNKQRILFLEHPLLHLFLLLLLTPVLKSVWGPFCLSMMSYLERVVAICQDTYTDTHNTHTHTHTHTHTEPQPVPPQFFRAALFAGVRFPVLGEQIYTF